ncbi:MAG TPA: Ig-like domain-containing protein [Kofleriaceae bacterium]|nr:Ig-like domain-containing protein [Kofleriaceae bacterium]
MMRVLLLLVLCVPARAFALGEVSPILFLNRCTNNCTVNGGVDDARAMSSSIPCAAGASCGGGSCSCNGTSAGTYTVEEFKNYMGQTGAAADEEWNMIVQCVREVYSPYNIAVTDVFPTGMAHTQGIVAGLPVNIGYGGLNTGGLGGTSSCEPVDNVISFTFANIFTSTSQQARVRTLCYVVAQETGHSFGLDHAFEFSDGRSACTDPMSYRNDCGGQRFFRNDLARCGENGPRPCKCPNLQNSHQKLLAIFGPGMPLTGPPTLTVSSPTDGATIQNGTPVIATAFAQRGVHHIDLLLNGYKWLTVKGAPFGGNGQPETTYPLVLPSGVPDGIIDIVVKAYDDIDAETDATLTVTKGAPCTTADTCAKGQKCDAGKCFWEPPVGELGDPCTYDQFCKTGSCVETTSGQFCSNVCVVGVDDSCGTGFTCEGAAGGNGYCVPVGAGDDTCCGIGANGKTSALLSLFVVGFVLRRKRR